MICCAQELGVHHMTDPRGMEVMTEEQYAWTAERRLLYSMGNWLYWQGFNDPYEMRNAELVLGLYRHDKTETPYLDVIRPLTWVTDKTAPLMKNQRLDAMQTTMIFPSGWYFSTDTSLATESIQKAVMSLHHHANMQADMILDSEICPENKQFFGDPKLIIYPAAQMVPQNAWDFVINEVKAGKTMLLSGFAEVDNYWMPTKRLAELGIDVELQPLSPFEQFDVDGQKIQQAFFNLAKGNDNTKWGGRRIVLKGETAPRVSVHNVGKGKLILCPIPVESGDTMEPVAAVYRYAAKTAGVQPVYHVEEPKPNFIIHPIEYEDVMVYTVINEGTADTVRFTDAQTGTTIEAPIRSQGGIKVWLNRQGEMIAAYSHNKIKAGDQTFEPKEKAAFYKG